MGVVTNPIETIYLDSNETVTCTFTNTKLPTLTVNKILSPVGHGAFDLMIDGTVYASNVGNSGTTGETIVSVGTHQVSETSGNPHTVMGDYYVTYGGDCNPDGSITLAAGENKTCTITNVAYGTIGITKDSLPNSEQNFDFTTTGTGLSNFSLDDDSNATLSNVQYFYHLMPGQYGITETGVDGWKLTGLNCNDTTNTTTDVATATASINLDPGESVYCTFTNTQLGKIIVEKQTLPDATEGSFEFYSSWGQENFFLSDGQQKESWLIPGSYSFNEIVPSGWALTSQICNSSIGDTETYSNLELDSGETITCVFTNTKIAPPLFVSKFEDMNGNQTIEDSERFLDGWTFELYENNTCAGSPSMTATTNGNLGKPGTASFENLYLGQTYWVKEVEQDGWTLTTGNCQSYTMHVDDNSNNQMYFGNQPDGSIHGYKWSDLDNSGTLNGEEPLLSGWTINLYRFNSDGGYELVNSKVTDNGQEHFGWYWFEHLLPGVYKVCEVSQSNWFQTFPINENGNCHIISLPSGNSNGFALPRMLNAVDGPVYSFGNQELSTVTVYKFHDLNANGTHEENEPYLSDWEININKSDTTDTVSQTTDSSGFTSFSLKAADYNLSETIKPNWYQSNIYCEDSGPGVMITAPGEAYGHHGYCGGWNGCGDAATCALWACEIKGYSQLVSYGESRPCTQFNMCHLFNYQGSIQYNWGNWCEVSGVTDIKCSNGGSNLPALRSLASQSVSQDSNGDHQLNLTPGSSKTCYIGNYQKASINVTKDVLVKYPFC